MTLNSFSLNFGVQDMLNEIGLLLITVLQKRNYEVQYSIFKVQS